MDRAELMRMGLEGLSQHRLRSILTMLGVIFGVAFGTSHGQVNLFPGTDIAVSSDWERGVSPEVNLRYAPGIESVNARITEWH